jgi:orotidine-5'-phosphate decarboxylase
MTHNPIICAIDTTDINKALELASNLKSAVGAIKLGLEFFTHHGAAGVKTLEKAGLPIFLDLKFHDIPNTVAGAIRATQGFNVFLMTIHAGGGRSMMEAAMNAAQILPQKPMVVGVTVLTSMDDGDLSTVGVRTNTAEQVATLATLAKASGLSGVVCSPLEIEIIRGACGKDFKLVVPGIRPAGSANGDQKRVLTPKEAVMLGANYLVIGRPITEAANPQAAAEDILKSL